MAGNINSSLVFSLYINSLVVSHVKWEKHVEHSQICLQYLTGKVSIYFCLSLQEKSFLIGFASQRNISRYKSHSKFCTPKMIRSLWTKPFSNNTRDNFTCGHHQVPDWFYSLQSKTEKLYPLSKNKTWS